MAMESNSTPGMHHHGAFPIVPFLHGFVFCAKCMQKHAFACFADKDCVEELKSIKLKKTVVTMELNSIKGIKNTIEICYYKKNSTKRCFTSKKVKTCISSSRNCIVGTTKLKTCAPTILTRTGAN
jgi:hypothetical protein